jgi:hypothetical protein
MVGGVVQQRAHEIRLGGSTIQSFPSIAATRHLPGKARGAPSVSPRAPSTAVPLIARTAGSARRLQTRALPAAAAAAAASLTTATAAAAAAPNMTQLMFTPATCLLGGLTLGVAAVGKFAITGEGQGQELRPTVAHAMRHLIEPSDLPWRGTLSSPPPPPHPHPHPLSQGASSASLARSRALCKDGSRPGACGSARAWSRAASWRAR